MEINGKNSYISVDCCIIKTKQTKPEKTKSGIFEENLKYKIESLVGCLYLSFLLQIPTVSLWKLWHRIPINIHVWNSHKNVEQANNVHVSEVVKLYLVFFKYPLLLF